MSYKTLSPSVPQGGPALELGPWGAPAPSVHVLDDPLEWASFGHPAGKVVTQAAAAGDEQDPLQVPVWESQVVLDGMHCATCALTIEDALRAVPGVVRAEVSGATRRAKVQWQTADVRPSQWLAAIERAGYSALPARDMHARELRRAENRRALWRWLVAGFCMMQVMMYAWPAYDAKAGDLTLEMETLLRWASWVISIPVVLFCCGPFFRSAWRDVCMRRISMDLPVALGMLITFVVSSMGTINPEGPFGKEVFYDSLTMFVFFLLSGRFLELRLRDKTAGALEAVVNRLPDSVERMVQASTTASSTADASPQPTEWERVAVRRLRAGDVVRVLAGEAFPADGMVLRGQTHADEALLTGESTPVRKAVGDAVTAGSYNLGSPVEVRVQVVGGHTRFAQIVALMESAGMDKPRLAQLADRVAKPFLVVVMLAALAAGVYWWPSDPSHAVMIAVAILIVTCPCALSLATPVAMLSAAGTLARHGVLVRNLQALESLAAADTLVFDKTGTLTRDGMQVLAVEVAAGHADGAGGDALQAAAALAAQSTHPVSRAVVQAAAHAGAAEGNPWRAEQVQEVAGAGVQGVVRHCRSGARRAVRLGSLKFAGAGQAADNLQRVHVAQAALPAELPTAEAALGELPADLLVTLDWRPWAAMVLSESVRSEAAATVAALQQAGVAVHLLSGDRAEPVARMAAQLGIAHARGECEPEDKLQAMQALQQQGRHVAMVGDGLNDGPVLAGAHVSFAFGRSVPLAQSHSDFVVLGDDLRLVAQTQRLARQTLRIVRQNLAWSAAYNAISIPLAVVGWMPAWLAGLGMALSSLLVVLNAARLARSLPALPELPGGARVSGASDLVLKQQLERSASAPVAPFSGVH